MCFACTVHTLTLLTNVSHFLGIQLLVLTCSWCSARFVLVLWCDFCALFLARLSVRMLLCSLFRCPFVLFHPGACPSRAVLCPTLSALPLSLYQSAADFPPIADSHPGPDLGTGARCAPPAMSCPRRSCSCRRLRLRCDRVAHVHSTVLFLFLTLSGASCAHWFLALCTTLYLSSVLCVPDPPVPIPFHTLADPGAHVLRPTHAPESLLSLPFDSLPRSGPASSSLAIWHGPGAPVSAMRARCPIDSSRHWSWFWFKFCSVPFFLYYLFSYPKSLFYYLPSSPNLRRSAHFDSPFAYTMHGFSLLCGPFSLMYA